VQLIDNSGFADSRIAGNQHQLRPAAGYDTIERRKQDLGLALPAVQFLRNQEQVGHVVFAQREFVNAALTFPLSEAASKITLHAGSGW